MKVFFIGAGPGDPELITIKAMKAIQSCPVILYAGSLVPRAIFADVEDSAEQIIDTASLDLEEIAIIADCQQRHVNVARVHSGDVFIWCGRRADSSARGHADRF